MRSVGKFVAVFFVCLVLASLLVITNNSTKANAASKPSAPEFTVKFIDKSYDVPPTTTTTTNTYTGEKTTITTPGYRVENKTIEITIKNQPFTPYTENGIKHNIGYKIQFKGHFGEDWSHWGSTVEPYIGLMQPEPSFSYPKEIIIQRSVHDYGAGYQVDFRVEAVIWVLRSCEPRQHVSTDDF
jgi:hypothetical protein